MRRIGYLAWWVGAVLALSVSASDDQGFRVLKAAPEGELDGRAQAAEIRVVFSAPVVALGRIVENPVIPYVRIEPKIEGSFRWSGTDTLIFTPKDLDALPYATRYTVTVTEMAKAQSGERLGAPFSFSFTTPTVRLRRTHWRRKEGRYDRPLQLYLRFNQPVRSLDVVKSLSLAMKPHDWVEPGIGDEARRVLQEEFPGALAAFDAKVAAARKAASSRDKVAFHLAADWDKKDFPPSEDLVVLETEGVPPTESWIEVTVARTVKSPAGPALPERDQTFTVQAEHTFFVMGLRCSVDCDPDAYNNVWFSRPASLAEIRRNLSSRPPSYEEPPPPWKKVQSEDGESADNEIWVNPESPEFHADLDRLGVSPGPASGIVLHLDASLTAEDGQTLGYDWVGVVSTRRRMAFSSFESGFGVWESSGGTQMPFSARNLKGVTQWIKGMGLDDLMAAVRRLAVRPILQKATSDEDWDQEDWNWIPFAEAPDGVAGVDRALRPVPDKIQAYGLELKSVLNAQGKGLVWAALKDGEPIEGARLESYPGPSAALLQVTDLGLSVKDSPQGTLVWVTRLSDASPVAEARVTLWTLDGKVAARGLTDEQGIVVLPDTDVRIPHRWWQLAFFVSAEKDGDTAFVGSDWTEGIEPWAFDVHRNEEEAKPVLRGTVFPDRGVYKLGEQVRLKAILRSDTPRGMALLPAGQAVKIEVKNSRDDVVDERSVTLNEWGGVDWTFDLPQEAPMGTYRVRARVEGQNGGAGGSFLVAAYRKPDFRVDAALGAEPPVAGAALKGTVTGRYLFGAPMAGREATWVLSRTRRMEVPKAVTDRFTDGWDFLDYESSPYRYTYPEREEVKRFEGTLDAQGAMAMEASTDAHAGVAYAYDLEGEVTDVSRQAIAGRAAVTVYPAPWVVGLKRPPYFAQAKDGVDTAVVAVRLDGTPAAGVGVKVTLTQVQWVSVRRAEGNGFYTWECERKDVPKGEWSVTSAADPVPLHVDLPAGGYYVLKATSSDAEGHSASTSTSFYALGAGYTAWERYDHNRIDLVPERTVYKPGETARIMVKSPWENAKVLLTTEREGVRTHRTFDLTSTQQTVEVPITEADIPNVYVSVLLVKGRTEAFTGEDSSDPGKPSFRLGITELKVEDASKRLAVEVKTDKEEYRPGARAKVEVAVADAAGKPDRAEVTLWAVDYGVLSLTGYKTPSVTESVWVEKALMVLTEDSRQRIVSRRVITPKGADEGGGGGYDDGPGTLRKDFRVLAFYLGSLPTDEQGRASAEVTLPESLTTYRVMAVVQDKASRFGWGQREIRTNKPVLLKPAFPRFLALRDKALFGAVVHSQLKEGGEATVGLKSLDPAIVAVTRGEQKVDVPAGGAVEVRFPVEARGLGVAKLQMWVRLKGEGDAFEDVLPVEVLAPPEVSAAYGEASPEATESLVPPAGVLPNYGGLEWETSSTALVGLGEGARYLVDYPYGCAEQRSSAALALLLAADLGEAFHLPGIEPGELKPLVQKTLKEVEAYQCDNGGFVYWRGEPCIYASAYLTSYVLHVFQTGLKLGYTITPGVMDRGYDFLEQNLNSPKPENEGWWPAYTAWQAFAVKVLAEGGRNEDSHVTRLYAYLDRMPVFAMAYLADAMQAMGDKGPRPQALRKRMLNAVLPEGGTAHVEELSDPYLLWFWNSNIRSTAIVLNTLVKTGGDELVPRFVRWLLQAREKGRWGTTQENAYAMEALVAYYRTFETDVPDFRAVVSMGSKVLGSETFKGRSSEARKGGLPMASLLSAAPAGRKVPLTFAKEGTGRLFYTARLRYAVDQAAWQPMNEGFVIERSYAPRVEGGESPASTSFKAGDLVKVTLSVKVTKEQRYVAVTDPLPAGFEPVESWFATTARSLSEEQQNEESQQGDWMAWWKRGGFDHVERHDDRVLLFATRLAEGVHTFSYVVRATTAGTFQVAPARAEAMYEPQVFGRCASAVVEVRP